MDEKQNDISECDFNGQAVDFKFVEKSVSLIQMNYNLAVCHNSVCFVWFNLYV